MGLDQYAYATKGEHKVEIAYWRKHANLQGWMENIYRAKGGEGQFNCVSVFLNEEDIDRLESEYTNLDTATGFFWGCSQPEDDEYTREFIVSARKRLSEGYTVEYTSWW